MKNGPLDLHTCKRRLNCTFLCCTPGLATFSINQAHKQSDVAPSLTSRKHSVEACDGFSITRITMSGSSKGEQRRKHKTLKYIKQESIVRLLQKFVWSNVFPISCLLDPRDSHLQRQLPFEYILYLIDMSKMAETKLKTSPLNPAAELQLRYSQTHIMSNSVNLA